MKNLPYFIKSCGTIAQIPRFPLKNIILIGRSNVGKSSLINSIAKTRIAKTSKSPGCTRTLNFFHFNKFILVDMPGYGYAKVSEEQRNNWNNFIYEYLSNSEINLCLVLIDSKVGFKSNDLQIIGLLKNLSLDFSLVFTKCDKAYKNSLNNEIIKTLAEINYHKEYILTSSKTKTGVSKLYSLIINNIEKQKIEKQELISNS